MRPSNLSDLDQLIVDATERRQSRRDILKRALALGLSAPAISALLAACGGDGDGDTTDTGQESEPTTASEAEATTAIDTEEGGATATSAGEEEGAATATTGTDGGEATAATGEGSAGQVDATGKIVMAMSVEPDTLENWKAYSTDGHPVIRNIQEALLNHDPETMELVGELATSWELVDDDTWRFKLREGVTFHNGDPFNAEVAAFGINYTWSPENAFEIYAFIGPDMTAEAVDEYTVDVTTEAPDPVLPNRLYFSPIPNMNQVKERPDSLPTEPIGTGPYSFVEWEKGQHIRLTANPDWWGHSADDAYGQVTIKDVEFEIGRAHV